MPFGRRSQGFRTRERTSNGLFQDPGRHRQKWLNRTIKLAAESSSHRGRNDPNQIWSDPQNLSYFITVHIRGLGGNKEFKALTPFHCVSGFRFYVGMFHVGSFPGSLGFDERLLIDGFGISLF